MKKMLLFIVCLFALTGCDIEYNLTINNDSFNENVKLSFLKQDISFETITNYFLKNRVPISNEQYEKKFYDASININDNSYDLLYKYVYDFDGFKNGFFVNNCYVDISIDDNNGEINIYSGKNFRCLNLDNGLVADSAKINIKTNLKVLEHNADNINGNVYTWIIDETNYETKTINLKLQKSNIKKLNFSFIIYIFIIIGLGILFILIKKNMLKINKFD